MKKLLESSLAYLFNKLIFTLHNRLHTRFSRADIRYLVFSFSQFGEDLAIQRWLDKFNTKKGIYVDVGAFHPIHANNTNLLHKQGWRGINIDLSSEKIARFNQFRPRDFNLVAAVSDSESEITILEYDGGLTDRIALSKDDNKSAVGQKPVHSKVLPTQTLDTIISQCDFPVDTVDYLDIDCEGHDLNVLKGLNLKKYKPKVITIEALDDNNESEIISYLNNNDYILREKIYRTLLFTPTLN